MPRMRRGADEPLDLEADELGALREIAKLKRQLDSLGPLRRAQRARKIAIVQRALERMQSQPSEEADRLLDTWLAEERKALTTAERRALVVRAVRVGELEEARELLDTAHDAFSRLTDEAIAAALAIVSKHGGATNLGAFSIAAELSIAVAAFGDKRREGESLREARERVTAAYKKAAARAQKVPRTSR
jgi:hypothetical protein